MFKKIIKAMDYSILVITVILFTIGIVALYSANGGIEGDISDTIRQLVWFLVGISLSTIIIFIDYDLLDRFWIPIYLLTTIALVAVLFTEPVNGATSWFNLGRNESPT